MDSTVGERPCPSLRSFTGISPVILGTGAVMTVSILRPAARVPPGGGGWTGYADRARGAGIIARREQRAPAGRIGV